MEINSKNYSYEVGPLLKRWEGDRMDPTPTLQRVTQIYEDHIIFLSKTGAYTFSDDPFGEGPMIWSSIHLK
jgi:hypothetical protein